MNGGVRFGRIFGIDLAFDVSWFLILLLIVWNLCSVFGYWHPAWPLATVVLVALIAAVLFFGSVVVHELAHSLVARAYGIPVRSITLFLFGGVSNIERDPDSPKVELLMAIVGPLVSLVLGLFFSMLAAASMRGDIGSTPIDLSQSPTLLFSQLGPASTLLAWLGPINILVGLFNLIPGFPLDGGRVLRAILWSVTGDLQRATRWATQVGQVFGWLLILLGVAMSFGARLPFFGTGFVSGLWLMFIGWFLSNAARQSYRGVVVHELLHGIPVSRLMRPTSVGIPAELPESSLVNDWFTKTEERALAVIHDGALIGLVCIGDVRKLAMESWSTTPVSDIMTPLPRLVSVSPTEDASGALLKLGRLDVGQLPVVNKDGQLVGMLVQSDVLRWLDLHRDARGPMRRSYAP